jgi:uncharacterized RmlC-like cupin family protein
VGEQRRKRSIRTFAKRLVCIGTRNEPTAQESVVLYPEMDAKVP